MARSRGNLCPDVFPLRITTGKWSRSRRRTAELLGESTEVLYPPDLIVHLDSGLTCILVLVISCYGAFTVNGPMIGIRNTTAIEIFMLYPLLDRPSVWEL